jgi:hypothetical protein
MKRTSRQTLFIGLAALAAALTATAATIPSPYRPTASPATAARLTGAGQEGLDLDAEAFATLRDGTARAIEIEAFPIAPGASGRLLLKRFEVAAPGARITIQGKDGETSQPMPAVSHFSGTIEGEPDSSVYLGATKNGLVAYVHSSFGHSYVGPEESKSGFVVRMAESPLNAAKDLASWNCGAEALPQALTENAEPSYPAPGLPAVATKQAAVRVETDYQLLHNPATFNGDANAMASYVLTLFGAINVIYYRDLALYLVVTEVHAWSVSDPYNGGDTLTQLYQLGDWWHANRPIASNPRTFVHYLSGHPVSGGIAWLQVLCAGDFSTNGHYGGGYGLTQVYGTYPLQFWDQFASAHEMGHNVASPHTHCYVPEIDKCYSGEQGCYVGATSVPPEKGTIMSYCHLLSGGYNNINLIFHARCISEKMAPAITGAACLTVPGTFVDVLPSDPFLSYIETVYAAGVTGGCNTNPLKYCPAKSVTREQMAVFLLKAKYGSGHTPPACVGTFTDVACSSPFAPWIEELAASGITAGCGSGTYCPADPVTRQQMAVFLLKAEHGSGYTPPACSSNPFDDVPCPSGYADWIKQLVAESITGGCSAGNYCPTSPVTRGQMAVFLVKTFAL